MPVFNHSVRVYYEDTDAQGVVYYANYLKFLERARSEWLRAINLPVSELAREHNVIFVVARVEIDYCKPAKLDDMLTVSVELERCFRVGFHLKQQIFIDTQTICNANLKMATLDALTYKPVRIPDTLNQLIS